MTLIIAVKGVCLGMSGVDRDDDRAEVTKYIKALLPSVNKPLVSYIIAH